MANDEKPILPQVPRGEGGLYPPSTGAARFLSRARVFIGAQEWAIFGSLLCLCVVVRVLWLTPVDIFGDAGQKWLFARQLAYANDFSHADWTHHMARLGINIPVFLLQRVLGTGPQYYYVVPVAAYTLGVSFTYLVGRRLGGGAAGVLSALFAIFYTGMIRSSSQLLPDGIAGSVLMVTCYCLLRLEEAEGERRWRWLLLVSGTFAWSYACKESNLLFFPGVLLCVWLSRRRWREASAFAGLTALYGALETAGFRLFTKHGSRFAIVQDAPEYRPIHFWQLFDRYQVLEFSWQALLWLWVASALWLATRQKKAFRPLLVLPTSFLFFLTFMVRHVHPLVPWMGNKSRYLAVVAPFFVLGIGLFVTEMSREVWRVYGPSSLERWASVVKREAALVVTALCLLLGGLTWLSEDGFHVQSELRRQTRVLNDAYRRNLPIVDSSASPRGLNTVYEVLLNDAFLTQADDSPPGWLPNAYEAEHRLQSGHGHLSYLLPHLKPYGGPRGVRKMIDHHCAVRISTPGSTIRIEPREELPDSCKAPGGELPRL